MNAEPNLEMDRDFHSENTRSGCWRIQVHVSSSVIS